MTKEELRNKAENLAITEARNYKTVYSEDFKLKEVLNDPLRFDQDFPERLYLLMKEKHYRDGFSDGYITGATDICKNIVKTLITTGLNNGKYGTLDEYNHIILRVGDVEECIKDLGINIYD